ncbi:hypothetical protein Tco_0128882 [Tanacetum coccineum]
MGINRVGLSASCCVVQRTPVASRNALNRAAIIPNLVGNPKTNPSASASLVGVIIGASILGGALISQAHHHLVFQVPSNTNTTSEFRIIFVISVGGNASQNGYKKISNDTFGQRTSIYRGVTRYVAVSIGSIIPNPTDNIVASFNNRKVGVEWLTDKWACSIRNTHATNGAQEPFVLLDFINLKEHVLYGLPFFADDLEVDERLGITVAGAGCLTRELPLWTLELAKTVEERPGKTRGTTGT